MIGCARCGACCEVIPLSATKKQVAQVTRGSGEPENTRSARFILKHWHRISRPTAEAINPRLTRENTDGRYFFTCDQYDAEHRLCLAQDTKPNTCSLFPFYGGDPASEGGIQTLTPFPRCSYWHAIPRDRWPEDTFPLDYIPLEEVSRVPDLPDDHQEGQG
jgi:Fe-S-cluster containining protein